MKTMKNFLSMAALALMGAMMTGCSSDDNFAVEQQPENKTNVVTLTATVGFDDAAGTTRALSSTGVKTFAEGETMAIIYKNTSNQTVKAVSEPLPAGDYGASATFTFTLTNPDKAQDVTYIYPAAMATATVATDAAVDAEANVNYAALATQDGTLATLSSSLDYCTNSGAWNAGALPSLTLNNELAILAINLKNSTGASNITSSITGLTLSDGTYTYNVSRSATADPIYVAIRPTSSATISITATDGTNEYGKTLATTKTYAANNGYNVTWNMSEMTTITWNSSNIGGSDPGYLYVSGTYTSYTKEGITLSANSDMNRAEWYNYGNESDGISFSANASGGFTFTAPTGEYFTKIEMTLTGPAGWDHASLGTGWAYAVDWMNNINKVTWTGTAANTVALLTDVNDFHGENVKSIVFTVY